MFPFFFSSSTFLAFALHILSTMMHSNKLKKVIVKHTIKYQSIPLT